MIDTGKVCVVLCGRRTDEKVTVKKMLPPYVVAVDSDGKERKYSVRHLKLAD
jgi:ribosomal protein L14E/L6E/L27E